MKLDRRLMMAGLLASGTAACVPMDTSPTGRLAAQLRLIEAANGGTLGVAFFDTGSGRMIGLNRLARFGHCSSFKLSLAAMLLWKEQNGEVDTQRRLTWNEGDLLSYAPFARNRLAEGATLLELAQAAQTISDNTATNLLLRELGGPSALTGFWRSIGDNSSRLDRIEPELNNVPKGELRDTSTPDAMARTVAKLAFEDVLNDTNRQMLRQWMVDTRTGLKRVRAGLPSDWISGDKTGTSRWPGMDGLYVDIGFTQPKEGAPISFVAYYRHSGPANQGQKRAEGVFQMTGEILTAFARQR